ncbi:MAG: PDZ domain-containing protein [Myxococcota bacterium]
MRAAGLLVGLAVLLAMGLYFLGPKEAGSGASSRETVAPPEVKSAQGPRKSVLEDVQLEAEPGTPTPAALPAPTRRSSRALTLAPEPALSGLEVELLSDVDRERMKVPNGYGNGVLVTRVHPSAPAAEAGLRPGDVIVRALRARVDTPSDLRDTVGNREQTLVIAARDGQLMQLVLQKPYPGARDSRTSRP